MVHHPNHTLLDMYNLLLTRVETSSSRCCYIRMLSYHQAKEAAAAAVHSGHLKLKFVKYNNYVNFKDIYDLIFMLQFLCILSCCKFDLQLRQTIR